MGSKRGSKEPKQPASPATKRLKFDGSRNVNPCTSKTRTEPPVLRPDRKLTSRRNNMIDLGKLSSSEFHSLMQGNDLEAEEEAKEARSIKKSETSLKKDALACLAMEAVNSPNITEEAEFNKTKEVTQASAKASLDNSDDLKQVDLPSSEEELSDHELEKEGNNNVSKQTSSQAETQTDAVLVCCGCLRCCGLFLRVMRAAEEFRTAGGCSNPSLSHEPLVPFSSREVADSMDHPKPSSIPLHAPYLKDDNDEMVPLVKGSKVKVSVTKKSNLRLLVTDGDPQKYVNALLDIFYSRKQQACITAAGRTKGSSKLDEDISDAMKAYVNHRYDKAKFNFNYHLFQDWVNQKCYAARKKEWAEDPEMLHLRPKLTKSTSKSGSDKVLQTQEIIEEETSKIQKKKPKLDCSSNVNADSSVSKRSKSKFKQVEPAQSKRPTTGGKQPKYILVEASTGKPANFPSASFSSPSKSSPC